MQKHFFYFPIREFTTSTHKAISEINRLASDTSKSFNLFFDSNEAKRVRVSCCHGTIRRASFVLTERTPEMEEKVRLFNEILASNPIVSAVGIESEICITVVC